MIDNKIKENAKNTTAVSSSTTTSPISRGRSNASAKSSPFLSWLRDEDTIAENGGQISAANATASFAKGLVEIVKTVYKRPVLSALTITAGIVLASITQVYLLAPVMGFCIAAGAAGIGYSIYAVATKKSSNEVKQSYELMGISALVLALGIYGILL